MVEQLNGHLLVEALAIGYFSSNSAHLGTTLAHRRPAIGLVSGPVLFSDACRNLPFGANMPAAERTACNLTPIDETV